MLVSYLWPPLSSRRDSVFSSAVGQVFVSPFGLLFCIELAWPFFFTVTCASVHPPNSRQMFRSSSLQLFSGPLVLLGRVLVHPPFFRFFRFSLSRPWGSYTSDLRLTFFLSAFFVVFFSTALVFFLSFSFPRWGDRLLFYGTIFLIFLPFPFRQGLTCGFRRFGQPPNPSARFSIEWPPPFFASVFCMFFFKSYGCPPWFFFFMAPTSNFFP